MQSVVAKKNLCSSFQSVSHKSLIQAPSRYATLPANASLVYDAICKTLSNRSAPSPKGIPKKPGTGVLHCAPRWSQFGPDEWQLMPQIAQVEGVAPLKYWKSKES